MWSRTCCCGASGFTRHFSWRAQAWSTNWLLRENVGSSRLHFHFGIRLAFDDLFDVESLCLEQDLDLFRQEEIEIQRNMLLPEFFYESGLVPDVKRQQHQPSRLQHAIRFTKYLEKRGLRDVHNRVERGDTGQRSLGDVERHHVSLPEWDVRVQSPRLLQHSAREIQPKDRQLRFPQIARHVTRPAAQVGNLALPPHPRGNSVQQLAVQRLVLQLVINPAGVLLRQFVVSFLYPPDL